MTGQVIVLIVALLTAAFAATAETALNSADRLRLRSLAEGNDRRARRVVRIHGDPNPYLSTVLTLNTVAVIVASAASVLISADRYPRLSESIVTLALAVVTLVCCEIAPKSLALRHSERVALAVGGPVTVLTSVLRPLVGSLNWLGTLPLRLLGGGGVRGPYVTEQQLKLMVSVGEEQGVVEQEEREMIHGVLEMTDKPVREVMVPRVDVVAVEVTHSIQDVVQLIIDHGHSRIPVYEETVDNVVGVVYAKDVLRHLVRGGGRPASVRSLAREPYFTPEAKKAGELLIEMQRRNMHIAVVVDEYGGTAGIVTMEDLAEEVFGPIRDEYDIAEQEEIQFLNDHEVLLNARVSIDDARELLHLEIGEDVDADSIGGLVYERLGEIPKPGATIALGDATLVVETVKRQSIRTVRITSPHPLVPEREAPAAEEQA